MMKLRMQLRTQLRWLIYTIPIGILAGLSSALFLYVLDWVSEIRIENIWLVYLLPLAGFFIGYIYFRYGGESSKGTNLVINQLHEPTKLLPRQMGFFVMVGTWLSHLFGASVGREGTALQLSSSLSEMFFSKLKLLKENDKSRKVILVCAKAGGFGAVFGIPLAGAIFALEVQKIGKLKIELILPVLATSFIGNYMMLLTGYHHFDYPNISFSFNDHLSISFWAKILILGIIFGITSNIISLSIRFLQKNFSNKIKYSPLRPFIGGIILIIAFYGFGSQYQGLSISLIKEAMYGNNVALSVFAIKILVTAIALSFGFIGGEVTPLFVIGATLGAGLAYSFGGFFKMDVAFIAALGLVAVFGGTSNTPIASAVIGMELFGVAIALPVLLACCVSYMFSVEKGIYHAQARPHHFKIINFIGNRMKSIL